MNNIRCEPHETGIVFEYEGIRYAWGARGYRMIGEEGVYPVDECRVPLIIRELVNHWRMFALRTRVDDLFGVVGRLRDLR